MINSHLADFPGNSFKTRFSTKTIRRKPNTTGSIRNKTGNTRMRISTTSIINFGFKNTLLSRINRFKTRIVPPNKANIEITLTTSRRCNTKSKIFLHLIRILQILNTSNPANNSFGTYISRKFNGRIPNAKIFIIRLGNRSTIITRSTRMFNGNRDRFNFMITINRFFQYGSFVD